MRILALVPGGIGDQILFFPTLDSLKRSFPKAEIDVVVDPTAVEAYRVSKVVHRIIPYNFEIRNSPADWANLLGVIRDREYEVSLSLCNNWSINLLLWLTGIRTRVGYGQSANPFFLTETVPRKPDQYLAHQFHDLLRGLGIATPCPDLAINVPEEDIAWADQDRAQLGLQNRGYVLIYSTASSALETPDTHSYPAKNWTAIIQDFQKRQPDLPIVAIQTPENQPLMSELTKRVPVLKISKPENLGQMAALIAGADLMLCTESDPMQLAVALKVFTLGLFGSQDPTKLIPQNERFLAIQSPTNKLSDIAAEDVLKKVWGE
ncbi:MAG: glycosyltransferase family 9 protein [Leptolyngbyaceae cyanobacterium MO_188.B28]|nr:glycosyltransferase family 9 protein [Leptolyngbyaceae cyanobacterium MO_188.B28]